MAVPGRLWQATAGPLLMVAPECLLLAVAALHLMAVPACPLMAMVGPLLMAVPGCPLLAMAALHLMAVPGCPSLAMAGRLLMAAPACPLLAMAARLWMAAPGCLLLAMAVLRLMAALGCPLLAALPSVVVPPPLATLAAPLLLAEGVGSHPLVMLVSNLPLAKAALLPPAGLLQLWAPPRCQRLVTFLMTEAPLAALCPQVLTHLKPLASRPPPLALALALATPCRKPQEESRLE